MDKEAFSTSTNMVAKKVRSWLRNRPHLVGNWSGKNLHRATYTTGRVDQRRDTAIKTSSIGGYIDMSREKDYRYESLNEIKDFPIEDGFDKVAAAYLPMMGGAAATVAGTVLGGLALSGIGHGIDVMANLANKSKYDKSLQDAIRMSPSLQLHGYSKLKAYLPMIVKASPTVAEEPRLLANYLESMLDAEGHMNLATFAELSALEGNVLSNRDYKTKGTQKFLEGAGKATIDNVSKAIGSSWQEDRRRLF